jgi:nucleoside transporter
MLLYCCCFFPTIPLTNTITFRHITNAATEFPLIRVFATIGWIVISLVIGGLKVESASTQFLLGSGLSLVMSLYCLTLPHTPPASTGARTSWRQILGLDAMVMLKNRSYLVFLISSVLACIPITFYFSFTNVYLNAIGWPNAAGKMSLGQASEVIMMLLMPIIYRRFSIKAILAAGLLAWAIRYSLFAFGNPGAGVWMLYAGILLHGICFDFFTMTGQMYTDQEAPAHLRSTAQGFLTFLTYGVGMFMGSLLSGTSIDFFTTTTAGGVIVRNWTGFWLTSSIGSLAIFFLILFLFRARGAVHSKTEALDDSGNYLPAAGSTGG